MVVRFQTVSFDSSTLVLGINNASPRSRGKTTLVFGGTDGIGFAIACCVAAESADNDVTIIGPTKPENIPHKNITFWELDLSLMREISDYTFAYKAAQLPRADLVVLCQGVPLAMASPSRTETDEGIDREMALYYYGRQLIVRDLKCVLNINAAVLFVLDGIRGDPSGLLWDDLDLKTHHNYSPYNAAAHGITMTDAMIQSFAATQRPPLELRYFAHASHPGRVDATAAKNLLDAVDKLVTKGPGIRRCRHLWRYLDGEGHTVKFKPE